MLPCQEATMFGASTIILALGLSQAAKSMDTDTATSAPLKTRWTDQVNSDPSPLSEYPRPQMVRPDWLSLNGRWDYTGGESLANPADSPHTPPEFPARPEHIKVPFPPESFLSGVMRNLEINMWYRREFTIPANWAHRRVLLHFDAVAETASIYVNGHLAGAHDGRWESFSLDITKWLRHGSNTVIVGANDPHDGRSSCGKNVIDLGDYTFTSGIWQTVWLEPVPDSHLSQLTISPDLDASSVSIKADVAGSAAAQVRVSVYANGRLINTGTGENGTQIVLDVPHARSWSPDDPFLYDLRVQLVGHGREIIDQVTSYFGMRSIRLGNAGGKLHPILNGRFVFQLGPLDQGYWPDGIQTAPTDDAIRNDLTTLKELGFNLVRKHAKVEPQRWYYWADKLGLLVWQDMPSLWYPDTPAIRSKFEHEWETIIQQHFNSPSIVTWVPFNENWGAYDVARITAWTKTLDPSRLVDGNSGYNNAPPYRPPPGDPGNGDFDDLHEYPGPGDPPQPSQTRAAALGEFGGIGLLSTGHMWPGNHSAYEMQPSIDALTTRFVELQEALVPLIQDRGLGAAVYTQLSDVEHEVNGVLTYDRAVRKMDFSKAGAAIRSVIGKMNARSLDNGYKLSEKTF